MNTSYFFALKRVSQVRSNNLRSVEAQAELGLARRPDPVAIPVELIWSKKSKGAAFTLACDSSGLEDKEISLAMGIDAGTFSRIKSGLNSLDADRVAEFNSVVGNNVYSAWQAYQVGCSLVMIQSEAERQIKVEHDAREKAEAENRLLRALLQGRAA